ncbi:MAG: hypothetical protein GY839_16015 [candidate division Zixibacteria bacterium]|nr:hypothetical protein [candidate division Zixibacteria bacterium]
MEDISAVRWWGIDLRYNPEQGFYECDEDPTEFEIKFYPELYEMPDTDNPTCAFTVVPERINTGVFYGYYSLIQFYAEFDACPITEGWISIRGTLADGDSCVFYGRYPRMMIARAIRIGPEIWPVICTAIRPALMK